jgi:DNA-binding response OmpR family regulator
MTGYRFDRLNILVVDDNAHMRKLVVTILQAFGTTHIYESADAQHAWSVARDVKPDVMFVDWMLEGMNGIELVKMIRNRTDSPNPFMPIIMLTGYTQISHVIAARDAGVNEFLAKPVSVTAVFSRLVSVIERPRPYVRTKSYFGPSRRRHSPDEYCGPERRITENVTAATSTLEILNA